MTATAQTPRTSAPTRRAPDIDAVIVVDRPNVVVSGIPAIGIIMLIPKSVAPNFMRQSSAGFFVGFILLLISFLLKFNDAGHQNFTVGTLII